MTTISGLNQIVYKSVGTGERDCGIEFSQPSSLPVVSDTGTMKLKGATINIGNSNSTGSVINIGTTNFGTLSSNSINIGSGSVYDRTYIYGITNIYGQLYINGLLYIPWTPSNPFDQFSS